MSATSIRTQFQAFNISWIRLNWSYDFQWRSSRYHRGAGQENLTRLRQPPQPRRDEDGPSWYWEMWDQLPELILTQIFSHLGHGDRANVAQVCRLWNRALSSPVLWRSVTVFIDRDLRGDFPLAGELTVRKKFRKDQMINSSSTYRFIYETCHVIYKVKLKPWILKEWSSVSS